MLSVGLAASTTVYSGGIACLNSTGYGVAGSSDPALKAQGVFRCKGPSATGTTTNGETKVDVEPGCFYFVNGDSIASTDIGKLSYVYDDQTVKKTNTGTMPKAGIIVGVDSTLGVAVLMGTGVGAGMASEFSYSLSYSQAWCYVASVTAYTNLTSSLPVGSLLVGYSFDNTDWVEGSTAIHADLGTSTDDDAYVVDIGNVDNGTSVTSGGICRAVATAGAVRLTLTAADGTLGEMTAGAATLKLYVVLP